MLGVDRDTVTVPDSSDRAPRPVGHVARRRPRSPRHRARQGLAELDTEVERVGVGQVIVIERARVEPGSRSISTPPDRCYLYRIRLVVGDHVVGRHEAAGALSRPTRMVRVKIVVTVAGP